MTQNFVRYNPDVEQMEPDFERTLQAVLDDMKQHMRGSLKTEGIGLVVRNAHAKGYGLARGDVEILGGMPNEYAQGISSHGSFMLRSGGLRTRAVVSAAKTCFGRLGSRKPQFWRTAFTPC